jgi:TonB-linked SusC/RagA family outer membrane protein
MLGMLLCTSQLLAQSRTITGRVTEANGTPIAGASVIIHNTNVGTVTNENGTFSIAVPENARVLLISAVGHASQEVTIGNQTSVNVTLQQSAQQSMQEVIVTTGYTRERRSQFAGAATVLSSRAVETVPVASFEQALQGRAPGMVVNSGSGQPGSGATVRIRGVQSIQGAGAQPLYVLDGIPMPALDFATLNPNDFESITVLKDANSAALYGARGGTGVIVITTKKGRAGVTNFTFRSQFGVTSPPDFSRLNLMNSAEMLEYEERLGLTTGVTSTQFPVPGWVYSLNNPGNANLPATSPAGDPFAPSQARYTAILDSIRGIDQNWRDVLYRTGRSQMHELNMSGGSDRTRVFLSAGVFDQQGIDLRSSLRRYTARVNLDHTTEKLAITWNTTAGFSNMDLSEGDWVGNSPRNPFQMTFRAKTYENIYKPDGTLNFGPSTSLNLKQVANLLEGIENSTYKNNQIKANSGLTIAYTILPKLTLRNTVGLDFSLDNLQRWVNPASYVGTQTFVTPFGTSAPGQLIEADRYTSQIINTTSAIYSTRIKEDHEVEAGAYFEVVRGRQRGFGFTLWNLDPRLPETGQGAGTLPATGTSPVNQNATSARTGFGIRSYFATARYTYQDKYTVNANIRHDGTSRIINPENREITTWSAGVMWNAMKETFMTNQKILSDLRVRATYGIVPNIGSIAVGSYGIGGITSVVNYQGPQVPSFTTTNTAGNPAQYAGSTLTGIIPSSPGNENLQIENIHKANLGVDFSLWRNRARFTIDAYLNRTVDLFVTQPLSASTGFGSLDINAGEMTNRGLEFTANVDVIRGRDLNIGIGFNHGINKNRIEDLGLVNEYVVGTFIIREGLPYGTHYTQHYLGVDPQSGRPIYETADGKQTTDVAQAANFAKFGTFLPTHSGGFTTDIRWKGLSVSALFSYQFDVTRYNNQRNWIARGTLGYHGAVNATRDMLTMQWRQPGDNALYQSPLYDRGFNSSDIENAKFLRFRNLIVAYQLPRIGSGSTTIIRSARIYVQGQNLAMWSPWRGLDPEDNNNISLNEYPNPRMFVAGIDINF